MSRASIPTLLSLNRYAKIMGLDPLHFAQGVSTLRPVQGSCSDIWFQYDWQDGDKVSRDQIGRLISDAERDIADAVKYWPAPVWIEEERLMYTKPQRTDLSGTGYNSRGQLKSLQTHYGYVIGGGVRATTLIGTDSYTTLDADGDTYEEWAVFTINNVTGVAACEVQAYFKVYDVLDAENTRTDPSSVGADDAWRVRPIYASISGTTLTVRIPRWELFKPQLQEGFAVGGDNTEINADDVDSYVDELTFYRVYNDPATQITFGWADEESCDSPSCAWATQTGCFKTRDTRRGWIVPAPATYDADDDEFTGATWAESVEPDLVWAYYYSGMQPVYSRGGCDPLDDWWARTIAMLATARLDTKLCTCANVSKTVDLLREDVSRNEPRARSFQNTFADLTNPFGSRKGEVEAWKRVNGRGRRRGKAVKF